MPPPQGCEFNLCCNFSISRMRVILIYRSLDHIYKRHTFISVTEAFCLLTWSLDWTFKVMGLLLSSPTSPAGVGTPKPSHTSQTLISTKMCWPSSGQQPSIQWWPLGPCWSAGHSQEDKLNVQWIRMRKWPLSELLLLFFKNQLPKYCC